MAKKAALTCKPCGYMVLVSDQGDAVIECYDCGAPLVPKAAKKPAAKKAVKAAAPKKLAAPKKAAVKKPAARKAVPKKKK
jgi:DNA-directed RNA polymerase subunit RPC12/RpoP